jgi:hypothetical protein
VEYLIDIKAARLARLLILTAILLFTGACAVRKVPPIRYVPGLDSRGSSSMEAILERALNDKNPVVRLDAVRLLGTMNATRDEQKRVLPPWGERWMTKTKTLVLRS